MPFVAVLDANVLWSAPVRDVILRAAERDLFRPAWSLEIMEELARSLKDDLSKRRPGFDPTRIDYLISQMLDAFPDALIDGYQLLIPTMRNHEKDRHVLAAAIRANASVIVTSNLQHFPEDSRAPYEIDLQTPDQFLCHLWYLSPDEMVAVLRETSGDLKNPPMTASHVIANLGRSVPQFSNSVLESQLL